MRANSVQGITPIARNCSDAVLVVMLVTDALLNVVAATVVAVVEVAAKVMNAAAEVVAVVIIGAVAVGSAAAVDTVFVADVTVGIVSIAAAFIPTLSTSIQESFE